MKKSNATLLMITMIVLMGLSWVLVVKNQIENNQKYENYIEEAKEFEEKEIYIDAIASYEKILKINPEDYDIAVRIAQLYYKMGRYNDYETACASAIDIDKTRPEMYIDEINYYVNSSKFTEAVKLLKNAEKNVKNSEELNTLATQLSYKCIEKYVGYEEIKDWHVQSDIDYVTVRNKDMYGMTLKDGKIKVKIKFDYLGAYDKETGVIPCKYEGQWFYVDTGGNKKLVADVTYDYLGSFGENYAPAERNGKYGFINTKFEEKNFEYEYAGAFANGVAAVKKDGRWALINKDMKMITGFDYDEILMDSYGYCSNYNVIVVKQNGQYIFIDKSGKKLSDNQFDGAKIQASKDGAIAIMNNGKWGFANQKGEVIIQPQYEDANSFSMNLAPVKRSGFWGYISDNNDMVVEAKYNDARPFSEKGAAFVKNGTLWNFIVLCEYDR